MKKIIYIFLFILPILLFSCSGSGNEAELKKQLEIAEQKNQELIQKSEAEAKSKSEAEAKSKAEAVLEVESSYKEILNNNPNMLAGMIDNIKSETTPALQKIYRISIIRYDDSFSSAELRVGEYECIADQSQQLDSMLKSDLELVVSGKWLDAFDQSIAFCKIQYIKADNKFLSVNNEESTTKVETEIKLKPKSNVTILGSNTITPKAPDQKGSVDKPTKTKSEASYSSYKEILNDNPNMLAGTADKLLWDLESGTLTTVDVLWIIRSDDSFSYPTSTQETWACRLAKYQPKDIFDVHLDYSVLNDLEVVVTGELKDSWNENTINNCKIQYIKIDNKFLDISDVITLEFLQNEFLKNKIVATKNYINKKITLIGTIGEIDYFSYSLLQEKAGFRLDSFLGPELTCFLNNESDAEIINTDQKIIFEGILDSYDDDWNVQMKFKSCSVISTIK